MTFINVGHAIPFPRYTHIKDGMLCNIYMYPYIATHKQDLGWSRMEATSPNFIPTTISIWPKYI